MRKSQEPAPMPPSGRFHSCYICGTVALWGPEWQSYGSILMEENWGILLKLCSDACRAKLKEFGGAEAVFEAECGAHGLTSKGKRLKEKHESRIRPQVRRVGAVVPG